MIENNVHMRNIFNHSLPCCLLYSLSASAFPGSPTISALFHSLADIIASELQTNFIV